MKTTEHNIIESITHEVMHSVLLKVEGVEAYYHYDNMYHYIEEGGRLIPYEIERHVRGVDFLRCVHASLACMHVGHLVYFLNEKY